ncbi:MAG: FeoA family protein [Phycisphaerales bacterium]
MVVAHETGHGTERNGTGGGRAVALASMRRGEEGVILGLEGLGGDEAAMLRAMGLGERVRVRMCREGEPVVVAVGTTAGRHCHCHGHCRIGLARGLAERVRVEVGARSGDEHA